MALSSIMSVRRASAVLPPLAATAAPIGRLPSSIDFEVLGGVGAELSMPINTMRVFVQKVREAQGVSEQQMNELDEAIESAMQIARNSQQIARLAEGRLRQSHEKVCLDVVLKQALERLGEKGIAFTSNIKPVEIIVDAALLASLIEAAVSWGADQGQPVAASLHIKSWPEYALLHIKVASPQAGTAETSQADSLNWHLLTYLAQAMGVKLERELSAETGVTLLLEFSRTVRSLEGLTTTEVHTGEESVFQGTRSMAGQRLLLVANDMLVRSAVEEAGRLLGLRVDAVSAVARARDHLKLETPHLIIIDERLRDNDFDILINEVRVLNPDIGLVEVANAPNVFEISSWMDNSVTRLGRDVLRAKLPCVLSLELARAL